ncbi:MAG: hypothetical protein EOM22_03910 [Gammaproteobacteria bacterium]|nr:hypothetical protein [Gammaproteobacteria bacterium]
MIDDRTTNLLLALPHESNTLAEDVLRLRAALSALDTAVFAAQSALASDDTSLGTLQEVVTALKAVQTKLASNDADFDTLQEVVDALKALQATVNTSALTSESIGVTVQGYDADLAALAGVVSAANKIPYFTGSGAAAVADFTAVARTLLAATTAAAQRAALGLAIGTDVQAQSINLTAIGGLTSAADRIAYFTGYGTAALATLTSVARTLLAAASQADQRTALGLGTAATMAGPSGAIVGTTDTQTLSGKTITGARETRTAPSISSGTLTLDCAAGNVFEVALNANITSLVFNNVPPSGTAYALTLALTANGTQRTVTWGAAVKWPNSSAPIITATSGKKDLIVMSTWDGGTTWHAGVAGQNY